MDKTQLEDLVRQVLLEKLGCRCTAARGVLKSAVPALRTHRGRPHGHGESH